MEFRKKRNSSGTVVSIAFLAIFVGIGGFLVYQNVKLFQKRADLIGKTRELQEEVRRLAEQGVRLQASVTENQTQEYQEKILREEGLYQKLGEQVITILPPETQRQSQQSQEKKVWWNPRTWF